MRRSLTGLLGLFLLAGSLSATAGEPLRAGPELWPEARRRELLHQQLREMLASPDADVQRLGVVFHLLGGYDSRELVPLISGPRRSAWTALQALGTAPVAEETLQAVLARLGADPAAGNHFALAWLEEHAPGWRARPELDGVIRQLLERLPDEDEEEQEFTLALLAALDARLTPHLPRLLQLAEGASEPDEAAKLLLIIPWNALGDQRDETIRRVSGLLLRHQSRSLDWDIWNAWRVWSGALTEAELDPLLRDALRYRESDAEPDYSALETIRELAETLDKHRPGWRERPAVRQAVGQLRAEVLHADVPRQQCGLEILIALGETRCTELHGYLLKHALSAKPEEWETAFALLEEVSCPDLELAPPDRQRLLQHWLKLLDGPPSVRWRIALNGLGWLGPEAKPAVPRLLWQMERMLWEDAEEWEEQPANGRDWGLTFDPEDFGLTLTDIDPEWKRSLAGRRIATLICDRLQWRWTHELDGPGWEHGLWEQFGWSTPGLRSLLLRQGLNPPEADWETELDGLMQHLDEHCPGWHKSPEARAHWRRLEPDYPWLDDPGRNRFFLRLTLHHPGLSRDRQRDYLLEALAAGLCLGREFEAALDALDPAWPQSPQVRQAVPILIEQFQAQLASEAGDLDLDCWRMLKRLGATESLEYPLLLWMWMQDRTGDDLGFEEADLRLPATQEALEQRLRELRPDFRHSPEVRRHRQRQLGQLADEDGDLRRDTFERLCHPELREYRSQADFQQLLELLTRLARCKEEEEQWEETDDEGHVIPRTDPLASRQLWQLRQTLRQQKILDGPILLPR